MPNETQLSLHTTGSAAGEQIPNIVKAATYIGQKIYSQPYTSSEGSFFRANFYYKCADGTIIYRPNHNIANILRTLTYLKPVIDYYAINGNDDVKEHLALIDENEIEKIRYILLFYTSGRENELNLSETRFKKNVFAHLEAYFKSFEPPTPFRDLTEVQHYANLLLTSQEGPRVGKDKMIALLLRSCHILDLLRCFPEDRLKKCLFKTFNENSKQKNTRNLQFLIFYAQNCIIATGDKLRTKYQVQAIKGSHHQQGFHLKLRISSKKLTKTGNNSIVLGGQGHNEPRFKAASRVDEEGIAQTLQSLEQVPKPIFFKDVRQDDSYTIEKSLGLIQQGNGVIRIINGASNDISLYFEFEQLLNPNFMRPLRNKKLRKGHTDYYDLMTQKNVTRPEKDYREISSQKAIESPRDILPYVSDKPISRQEDRGKPKKTIFSKKQSYSLLPSNGIIPLFSGRLEYRIKQSFVSIGTLYDLDKMHHKGERYIWRNDVRTSGINGYFWLPDKNKPEAVLPSPRLNTICYSERCSITDLKEKLQTDEGRKFNEMLMGASLDSLNALFSTKDNRRHRLAVLHASTLLSRNYGITRPLLIIDGKSEPKEYSSEQIKADLIQARKKYQKWYWRLIHSFIPTEEHRLLLGIIGCVSSDGLKVDDNELIRRFTADQTADQKESSSERTMQKTCSQFTPSEPEQTSAAASTTFDHSISEGILKTRLLEYNRKSTEFFKGNSMEHAKAESQSSPIPLVSEKPRSAR